jgi:hypothetical protein
MRFYKMDKIEIRRLLVERHLVLTYEEWYELNRLAFELVDNNRLPCDLYQEYIDGEVDSYHQIELKRMREGRI